MLVTERNDQASIDGGRVGSWQHESKDTEHQHDDAEPATMSRTDKHDLIPSMPVRRLNCRSGDDDPVPDSGPSQAMFTY